MASVRGMMSGEDRGWVAAALRAATAIAEPFYAGVASLRNRLFQRRWMTSHRIPRPVISVGNITAGGTGKTPMIELLAAHLRSRGRRVAILARGYKSAPGALGDEQEMLQQSLAGGNAGAVRIIASPRRAAAAMAALADDPKIDLFLLDDGFQHRAVQRDLDIVLISATLPFGHGHVLPRGLLREPMSGLRRADAIIITHADQVSAESLLQIETQIRQHNMNAALYRAVHAHESVSIGALANCSLQQPIESLATTPFFAFGGIGDPSALEQQLRPWGDRYRGGRWFPDHHPYTLDDLQRVDAAARGVGAVALLTTAKDWAKIGRLTLPDNLLPIWRIDLSIRFFADEQAALLSQVDRAIDRHSH